MNNHRGGWALVKANWASWIEQRGFFWLLAFGWAVPLMVYLFVWRAAAADGDVGGLSQDTLMMYFLALILVNQLTYSQTNWTVGDVIRYGGISQWFLRPIPPIYNTLTSEAAGKVVYMLFAIPLVLFLGLLLRPAAVLQWQDLALAIPALLLAWALRFFWGYWIACLAFWASTAESLLLLQDTFVFVLGGQVSPIPLLPQGLQVAARLLPFRYMLGFPVEVVLGMVNGSRLAVDFAIQLAWTVAAVLMYRFVWARGARQYTAVGG
ncbi:MAG: ABC-2 family transporter protein [Anaerolineae bacterium]|nr:ABC-2 family transporter protein [Anaerolineae bacterium]